MKGLPVDLVLDALSEALRQQGAAVLVAPPGSGKTTRVPPGLLARGHAPGKKILMLEPRRVAARAAAQWLARERGEEVGDTVGYAIRFERVASARTRVLVVTEGLLTRRLLDDPFLEDVGLVILDEFHERSQHADLSLALLQDVRKDARPDLQVVVMSATIDPEPIARYLGGAAIIRSDGQSHPVELVHEGQLGERLEDAVREALRRHFLGRTGDALVFLPGVGEIQRVESALAGLAREAGASVLPLHGELPIAEQDRALQRGAGRRIVLATNVAETSVTVQGVRLVIDSGLVRRMIHDPDRGLDRLELGRVSRASADQRTGRAGREAPGRAVRLWPAHQDIALEAFETPELLRADLTDAVLALSSFGIADPLRFRWFEPPADGAIQSALQRLRILGALSLDPPRITPLGRTLEALGLGARLGRVLVEAWRLGIPKAGARAVALLSERDLLGREAAGRVFPTGNCDLVLRLDLLEGGGDLVPEGRRRRVLELARSIERRAQSVLGAPAAPAADEEVAIRRAVLAGYADRLGRRRRAGSEEAVLAGGRALVIAKESVARDADLFAVLEVQDSRQRGEAIVRQITAIERAWLEDLEGAPLERRTVLTYDRERDRVAAERCLVLGDFVVERREESRIDPAALEAALADALRRDFAQHLAKLPPEVHSLRERLEWLAEARPELGLETYRDERLLEFLIEHLPGRRRLGDLLAEPIANWMLQRMPREHQRQLADEAPEDIPLPSGRRARLRYERGRPPILSARVQHLFGLIETPKLAGGRVTCLVELLAPNHRPVQLTQDLPNFWRTTYAQVRKDLRGRYPKHDWPEVPPGLE